MECGGAAHPRTGRFEVRTQVAAANGGADHLMNGMKDGRANTVNAWRTLAQLRRFVLPHWPAVACAVGLMMVEAAMDLLKPFPLKWTLDVILKQRHLTGETLYLLLRLSMCFI